MEIVEILLDLDAEQGLLFVQEISAALLFLVHGELQVHLEQLISQFLVLRLQVIDFLPQPPFQIVHSLLFLDRLKFHFVQLLQAMIVESKNDPLMVSLAAVLLEDGEDLPNS